MPGNDLIQYGSFGLVVFVVAWFVLRAFPQMVSALTASIDKVLQKIDAIEANCRAERLDLLHEFQKEREADRIARHSMANQFTETISKLVVKKHGEGTRD